MNRQIPRREEAPETVPRTRGDEPAARRNRLPWPCCSPHTTDTDRERVDGSSPRVRGTEHLPPGCAEVERFIPACAGNRSQKYCRSSVKSVHPRVCGEQTVYILLKCNDSSHCTETTDFQGSFSDVSRGVKLTSLSPSKSTGIRRLWPIVAKSKPWSVGARHTITASPVSMYAVT